MDIANRTGFAADDVARALKALDGVYVDLRMTMGDAGRWFVNGVTSEARRAVGQWPSGDSLVARLVEGLEAAAEREADPLVRAASARLSPCSAGPCGQLVDVAEKVIERSMGLG